MHVRMSVLRRDTIPMRGFRNPMRWAVGAMRAVADAFRALAGTIHWAGGASRRSNFAIRCGSGGPRSTLEPMRTAFGRTRGALDDPVWSLDGCDQMPDDRAERADELASLADDFVGEPEHPDQPRERLVKIVLRCVIAAARS